MSAGTRFTCCALGFLLWGSVDYDIYGIIIISKPGRVLLYLSLSVQLDMICEFLSFFLSLGDNARLSH